jgi:hypothetical protein
MATAKKAPAKKAPAKKAPAKKAAAKKAPAKKAAPSARPTTGAWRPSVNGKPISGYTLGPNGMYLPIAIVKPAVVSSSKLRDGLEAAQGQIKKTLQGFAAVFTQDFEVSKISLTLSFSAEGKFLGFGAGGAMSVSVEIEPSLGTS